jgi:hypothetical protein
MDIIDIGEELPSKLPHFISTYSTPGEGIAAREGSEQPRLASGLLGEPAGGCAGLVHERRDPGSYPGLKGL